MPPEGDQIDRHDHAVTDKRADGRSHHADLADEDVGNRHLDRHTDQHGNRWAARAPHGLQHPARDGHKADAEYGLRYRVGKPPLGPLSFLVC